MGKASGTRVLDVMGIISEGTTGIWTTEACAVDKNKILCDFFQPSGISIRGNLENGSKHF